MNRMEQLLNKIERRLGTKMLNLPPELAKDSWAEVIDEDSLSTFSRYFPNDILYMLETETIDNGDGTFDIVSTLGSEVYNVKILAFGSKIKANDDTKGLVLASNGIKYTDKSGSSISIINGNIKLSNSDGSGKLEIKKDGLYINDIKQ